MSPPSARRSSVSDRRRRARASWRHLPQLGLHPDQGAAAHGRDFSLHASCQGLRPHARRQGRLRCRRRGETLARDLRAAQRRRRLSDEEEQGRRDLGRGDDRKAREGHRRRLEKARRSRRKIRSRKASSATGVYEAKHIIVATGARPRALPGIEPDGKLIWTYFEAMKPEAFPEEPDRHGFGRDRDRIRLVLSHHGRRGDGRRSVAADSAGRGRRNRRLMRASASKSRESRSSTSTKVTKVDKEGGRTRRDARGREGRDADAGGGAASFPRSASSAMSKISASKR